MKALVTLGKATKCLFPVSPRVGNATTVKNSSMPTVQMAAGSWVFANAAKEKALKVIINFN